MSVAMSEIIWLLRALTAWISALILAQVSDVAEGNMSLLFNDELNNLHFDRILAVEEKEWLDFFLGICFLEANFVGSILSK